MNTTTSEITTDQLVIFHVNNQPVTGVILACDGDKQQAKVRAHINGSLCIVTVPYTAVEVRR